MAKKKDREQLLADIEIAAQEGVAAETIQRYGSAAKEHFVAYSGADHEAGKTLKRSLKGIAKYKVNPKCKDMNIRQQAGFSAETKTVARRNAERIIKKDGIRSSRLDDLGSVNHELYDLVDVDKTGKVINGSGSQMKFVGDTPDKLLDKLKGQEFQKYLDVDAFLDVADDDYDVLMGINGQQGLIDQRIENLKKQVEAAKQRGKQDVAEKKQAEIEKYLKIKKNLRKTGLTREEAIFARLHPKLSTAKDVAGLAHRAGVQQAEIGAVLSGGLSIIRNTVACFKGEVEPDEAGLNIVKDTGRGALVSYTNTFVGTALKGYLQNSSEEIFRNVSKTNLPGMIVTGTVRIGKAVHGFVSGELDGPNFVKTLGNEGAGSLGAAMFTSAGVILLPATAPAAVGIAVGLTASVIGYTAGVALLGELDTALTEASLAREERLRIERECAETIELIKQYRDEMAACVEKYFTKHIEAFNASFAQMDEAIILNDVNGFIRGNAALLEIFGKKAQFQNQEEFDALMESDQPFIL